MRSDEEYRKFLAELGGAPPPEMMGMDSFGGGEGGFDKGARARPAGWRGAGGGGGRAAGC